MLRIATIGTSMICENFIEALDASPRARFAGTLSRDAARAREFSAAHGSTQSFSDLETLAHAEDVDAVYIASPNAVHAPQALSLIEAGKHVLMEKPFASNQAEARRVFDAAEAAGVVTMEALRSLHDPAFIQIRHHVEELSPCVRATLRFGKYSSRYDELLAGRRTNIFDCAMASGGLMDIGIYCVETMVALFGAPEEVTAAPVMLDASMSTLTSGPLDGAGSLIARYPWGIVELAWSKITNDNLPSQVECAGATLTFDSVSLPSRLIIDHRGRALRGDAKTMRAEEGARREEIDLPQVPNTMAYELDHFVDAVEAVRAGGAPAQAAAGELGDIARLREITLASLAIADEARRQAGIVFPADRASEEA